MISHHYDFTEIKKQNYSHRHYEDLIFKLNYATIQIEKHFMHNFYIIFNSQKQKRCHMGQNYKMIAKERKF